MAQVCKSCGSEEVARLDWVNPNTQESYENYKGDQFEWCMKCNEETEIIEDDEFINKDDEERYMDFLDSHYGYIKGVQSKYAWWGGNSLPMALGDVEEEYKNELEGLDWEHIRKEEILDHIFRGEEIPD